MKTIYSDMIVPYLSIHDPNLNYDEFTKSLGFAGTAYYKLFYNMNQKNWVDKTIEVCQASPGSIIIAIAPLCVKLNLLYHGYYLMEIVHNNQIVENGFPTCKSAVIHWMDEGQYPRFDVVRPPGRRSWLG